MIFQFKTGDTICTAASRSHTGVHRIPFRVCYVTTAKSDFERIKKLLRFSVSCPLTEPLIEGLIAFSYRATGITDMPNGLRPVEKQDSAAPACFRESLRDPDADLMLVAPCYPEKATSDLKGRVPLGRVIRKNIWSYSGPDNILGRLALNLPDRSIPNMCVACLNILNMQAGECRPGCAVCRGSMLLTIAEDLDVK